jgi:Fe-S-cluster-containing dehydrogenase component
MTHNTYLSDSDIRSDATRDDGRPVSPAPLVDGDLSTAESIDVVFPDGGPNVTLDRRDFMRLTGTAAAAGALTATAACQIPVEKVIPYVDRPEGIQPGKAAFYSTTSLDGSGTPLRVKVRGGRPIHIEGNPSHPAGGGASVRQIAAIMDLYDPDRGSKPAKVVKGEAHDVAWTQLDQAVRDALHASRSKVRLLTGPVTGTATLSAINEFVAQFSGKHIAFTPDSNEAVREAAGWCYGLSSAPTYRFAAARSVVGFGADFLDHGSTRTVRDWAAARSVETHGEAAAQTVIFSAQATITGASADRRYRVRSNHLPALAGALAKLVATALKAPAAALLGALDVKAVATTAGVSEKALQAVADRLVANAGASIVIAGGPDSTPELEVAVNLLNDVLGNNGKTVLQDGRAAHSGFAALRKLVQEMNSGSVDTLIIAGTNPVLAGSALGFAKAAKKVANVVVLTDRLDENGAIATWYAPLSHALESWGDEQVESGVHNIAQPTISPIGESRSLIDALINWSVDAKFNAGGNLLTAHTAHAKAAKAATAKAPAAPASYHYVKQAWNWAFFKQRDDAAIDAAMAEALRVGFIDTEFRHDPLPFQQAAAGKITGKIHGGEATSTLILTSSAMLGDGMGVQANNGWLQELADPVSKVVWDNVAYLSPSDMEKQNLVNGDVIEMRGESDISLPALALPGQADNTIVVALGYGRTAVGDVGNGIGQDAFNMISGSGSRAIDVNWGANSNLPWYPIAVIGGDDPRDGRGIHFNNEILNNKLRPLAPEATLAEWKEKTAKSGHVAGDGHGDHADDHGGAKHYNHEYGGATFEPHGEMKVFTGGHPGPSLWPGHEYTGYRWAMTIDTNTCTGCSACVIACQSENNVPVVGRKGVLANREMSWLRIDRYYSFDRQADDVTAAAMHEDWDTLAEIPKGALDNPKVHVQPMLCQHCENAGCETVCPFTATMHDEEGVNQQIYNRCVGTRYCANNCAYKVRRYNWFEYGYERDNWLVDMVHPEGKKQGRMNMRQPLPMRLNPEVTVRTRGVMEKCSFCTQRVQTAKHDAESDGRRLTDADLQTACQSACSANAISFGDINNPASQVSKDVNGARSYRLLEEVGAKPSVFYMARIWNA